MSAKRITIIGSGGREHALAWRLAREGHTILALPGNPGMTKIARCIPANVADIDGLVAICHGESPDLVVVGPEAPLAEGLVDKLLAREIRVFGPTQRAARIESSKKVAKDLMLRAKVPTARFVTATTPRELDAALAELGGDVVVKADGLAAGKGVVVCNTKDEAREAGMRLLERGPVIVEEKLTGPELSVIAITDGTHSVILPTARDHKRLLDGDRGPNTGGMGTVAPIKITETLLAEIRETIIKPTLAAMREDGSPFVGALFAGLMLTPNGPKTLEFNARFGDPETQSIMGTLGSNVQLGALLHEAASGQLHDGVIHATTTACTVVLASRGYPDSAKSGDVIEGIDAAEASGAVVFHAGTKMTDGRLVTAGGRVLGVMATGSTIVEARAHAMAAASKIQFAGKQFRTDIGATSE